MEKVQLIERWITGSLDAAGRRELSELLDTEAGREWLAGYMDEQLRDERTGELLYEAEVAALQVRLRDKIAAAPARVIPFARRWRWVAAAVLVVAISTTFLLVNRKEAQPVATAQTDLQTAIKAPASNRATITLGDGRTVYLDNVADGPLADLGGVALQKLADGQIAYHGVTGLNRMPDSNTVSNPRGSTVIDLTLADGSRVWLNAGSSLRFPVAFVGASRSVELDGEGYFEVKADKAHPFVVTKGKHSVTVLGTHFNVKAYANEATVKVTLLEGSVRVQQAGQVQMLLPGQQTIAGDNGIALVKVADTEEAIAWKSGYTSFHSADLRAVLNEIERWYNIETEVQGNIPDATFYADVKRSADLSNLLNILKGNNIRYRFDADKRKLVILP